MLRITITDEAAAQKWVLQGWLIGPWVAELKAAWLNTREAREGRRCLVDLHDVVFVDPAGELVLKAMLHEGAEFVGTCGIYNRSVIASLERNRHRP